MAAKKTSGSSRKKSRKGGGSSAGNPVLRITDTTLRDAHQSLWATRMRTADMLEIMPAIDAAGYYSLEMWGGATFDVCMRFLRENPWERLRQIKSKAPKTPLQMLLRGQNVLGYRNYPDDLLDRFVALACENGIDIFRIFDALNDSRNLEHAVKSVKKHGAHAQGTLCYTVSPVHTVKQYVRDAKEQAAMGIDSLCIKDMAGIMCPAAAEELVSALTGALDLPVQLHCHATSGMAVAAYLEGVKAGAGAIDCAISPMSGFSSQPAVETMISVFGNTPFRSSLDMDAIREICAYFEKLAPHRRPEYQPANIIDPGVLMHHIPGGMISNLRSQLQQQDALDRLNEVLEELPTVRADLGYPPLVTPTSQIVGVQAVMNVLSGERYSMVSQETKDYVRGLYGRAPGQIDPKVRRKVLGKEKPITCRPADLLDPALPTATHNVNPDYIKSEEDILSYCLFPEPALEYFRWRSLPEDERPPPPADKEKTRQADTGTGDVGIVKPFLSAADYDKLHDLVDRINELGFSEISMRKNDVSLNLESSGISVRDDNGEKKAARPEKGEQKTEKKPAGKEKKTAAYEGPSIKALLNGTFYNSPGPGKEAFVKPGDEVKSGDPVCVIEAMKLFNQIKAPSDCRIAEVLVEHGEAVRKGQPLFAIELL
ncbi:MAG: pyruvate/oxaloacetate carboxyltransferase [Kiritimatiellia bacterium]